MQIAHFFPKCWQVGTFLLGKSLAPSLWTWRCRLQPLLGDLVKWTAGAGLLSSDLFPLVTGIQPKLTSWVSSRGSTQTHRYLQTVTLPTSPRYRLGWTIPWCSHVSIEERDMMVGDNSRLTHLQVGVSTCIRCWSSRCRQRRSRR